MFLFGILLATGSFFMPNNVNQIIVDKQEALYMNDLGTSTGCNGIRQIAAHSYKPMGKKIVDIPIGKEISFDECRRRAINYTIEEIKTFNKNELRKKNGRLYMQTCYGGGNKFAYILEFEAIGRTRRIFSK